MRNEAGKIGGLKVVLRIMSVSSTKEVDEAHANRLTANPNNGQIVIDEQSILHE